MQSNDPSSVLSPKATLQVATILVAMVPKILELVN